MVDLHVMDEVDDGTLYSCSFLDVTTILISEILKLEATLPRWIGGGKSLNPPPLDLIRNGPAKIGDEKLILTPTGIKSSHPGSLSWLAMQPGEALAGREVCQDQWCSPSPCR